MERVKPWTISASVRGFYDDNYTTLPSHGVTDAPTARSSYGLEISPSLAFNYNPNETTLLSASAVYDLKWYEDRSHDSQSPFDQSFQLNAKADHEFSEKYKAQVNESFVIAQEPTVITPGLVSTPLRVSGNNLRNTASLNGTAELTHNVNLELSYANTLYDYQQEKGDVFNPTGALIPSRSALLDRDEHLASASLHWRVLPQTMGILGYQFGIVDYTSSETIALTSVGAPEPSNARNSLSHYLYVGADQTFSQQLSGSVRVGGTYLDYYNLKKYSTASDTQISPYADASLTYLYTTSSSVQIGVKHIHNATDIVGSGADPVKDQESTGVYGSIIHKLTPNLTGSLLGQFQRSVFNGGGPGVDGKQDQFFTVGLNLAYQFNPYILVETGYNYDKLNSDLAARSYSRDQVYVGVRATY